MKVTCTLCKRRIKVKPGIPHECKCGNVLDPFPSFKYDERFQDLDFSSVREIGDRFFNGGGLEEKLEMVHFLIDRSSADRSKKLALLTSIDILRRFKDTNCIDIARGIVNEWPGDFTVRFMLANCLDLSGERSDHLEALKQRMIATTVQCRYNEKKGKLTDEKYSEIMKKYIERLSSDKSFLMGLSDHSCDRVEAIVRKQVEIPDELVVAIRSLEEIWIAAGISPMIYRVPKKKCVVDTNALSNWESTKLMADPDVEFIAPLDVLIELSNWGRVDRLPFELENVKIMEVDMKVPREVDEMFSKTKGMEPSLTDKKVATLAIQERADAIISNDRDLWDTGLPYKVEKNYGISMQVVRSSELERWMKRNT